MGLVDVVQAGWGVTAEGGRADRAVDFRGGPCVVVSGCWFNAFLLR
jgi:hypothetical protein